MMFFKKRTEKLKEQLTIAFSGGGTAGHVTPNIALMEKFQTAGWRMIYLGSKRGMEKELIRQYNPELPYFAISCEKLRRSFSWRTLLIPFKLPLGCLQAWHILRREKVDILFSKGGFVSLPAVIGAWLARVPIITHESDTSPGLANRLIFPFCRLICVTFDKTKEYFTRCPQKVVVTGTPIRKAFFVDAKAEMQEKYHLSPEKPLLLAFGGSLGAHAINSAIRKALPDLLKYYQVIHVCGRGRVKPEYAREGYQQYEYISEDFPHLLSSADYVISRAGANSIYELISLRKPHILVPYCANTSRGDQPENAEYFKKKNISIVLQEDELDTNSILFALNELDEKKEDILDHIKIFGLKNAVEEIYSLVLKTVQNN